MFANKKPANLMRYWIKKLLNQSIKNLFTLIGKLKKKVKRLDDKKLLKSLKINKKNLRLKA